MKQSIQLRLGQSLTMTPQLQQAIRLLQLSTLELQAEVQQALESNPMLDTEDDDAEAATLERPDEYAPVAAADDARQDDAETEAEAPSTVKEIPDELPVDSAWEDVYDGGLTYGSASEEDDREMDYGRPEGTTLRDHLLWQARLTPFSETEQAIASAIIDGIGDDGYLHNTLDDIAACLAPDVEVETDEVEVVLHRIQRFDPPGIAARNPGECLSLQLRQLPADTPWRAAALAIAEGHLDLLASRDTAQLQRRLKLDDAALAGALALLRSLNPRPGNQLDTRAADFVTPDVIVRRHRGTWRVELNPESMPRLRINHQYANLVRRADNSHTNTYLRNQLQEARWFLKSLQSRHETLLKVATAIVERQRGFFDLGEEAMRPLVLRDIAEAVSMHESTISRVTTQKYMHTPRGVYEFKFFFSSHVSTADGGECSATAIRALIRKLVAAENPAKPLSDARLADIMTDQGINVARRTIAKYREALMIPPSHERKRLV